MDCAEARRWMAVHLGGEDATAAWRSLRDHLDACPTCKAEARALTATWEALAMLSDDEVPAGVWERIEARMPARGARRRIAWAAPLATAALGLLISIAASWLLPYERAVRLCSEALGRLLASPAVPDPAVFFAIGILYGLVPLGLAALVAKRGLSRTGGRVGIWSGLVFGVLAFPYVIVACRALPGTITAALMLGIFAGGLAGGPAGLWAGDKVPTLGRT